MIIFPAIDLRRGRCVRLQQGDADAETVFANDPVDAAKRWADEGAEWLHVVNLDGALGESGAANLEALERILAAVQLPVQFGGGLRSIEDIERLLKLDATRVILGTVAVRRPELVEEAIRRFGPERVCVGIDARDGKVVIHGWVDATDISAVELGRRMAALGVQRVIYTDVSRDGMLSGANVDATRRLAAETGMNIIASGGVASISDIASFKLHEDAGIEGVVIGMALYQGTISLSEALDVAKGAEHVG